MLAFCAIWLENKDSVFNENDFLILLVVFIRSLIVKKTDLSPLKWLSWFFFYNSIIPWYLPFISLIVRDFG